MARTPFNTTARPARKRAKIVTTSTPRVSEIPESANRLDSELGPRMHDLVRELYPICRSITGQGVRDTLGIVRRHIPLALHEVPSGTPVFGG